MNSIKIILENLLKKHSNNVPEWHYKLFIEWGNCVGNLKNDIILLKIENSTLILGVYKPQVLHQLRIISNNIIKAINKQLGYTYVYSLDYKLINNTKRNIICP